jgi:hypothetical protein
MVLKNNNESFIGKFKKDEYHKGILNLNNRDIYEGEFKNNRFNYEGIYKFKSGDVYKGTFLDG